MTDNQLEKIKRLKIVRDTLNIKQGQMAKILNINRANLSAIENGRENRKLPNGTDYILEKELNINPVWFNYGTGEMFITSTLYQDRVLIENELLRRGYYDKKLFVTDSKTSNKSVSNESGPSSVNDLPQEEEFYMKQLEKRGVPFYESDVTGTITGSFQDIAEEPAFYVDFKPFNDCAAYFTIYGDSMYPKYASGEIVAIKNWENRNTMLWGEAYLVITDSTENNLRTVKTVHPSDDKDYIILRATNPAFKGDTPIRKDAVLNVYLVKGKIRKDHI